MQTTVETEAGTLDGAIEGGVVAFRGVRFGEVPARWAPARPARPWTGVRRARSDGPWAPQNGGDVLFKVTPTALSEDCLHLNLWTPAPDALRRPVMVWIHGGAFQSGSCASPIYDGRHLARDGDVVVVANNYRVGALGFLRLVDVTQGRIPSTGNEGLGDQRLALEWIARNIERFGGDPHNVTLFGESAGAMSVGCHMASPGSAALFHRAITQSGACHVGASIERANQVAHLTLEALGIAPTAAGRLRELPVERILSAQLDVITQRARAARLRGMPYQPVLEPGWLPAPPLEAVRAGSAAGKPLLAGTNLEESKLYNAVQPSELWLRDTTLRRRLEKQMGTTLAGVLLDVYVHGLRERGVEPSPFELSSAIQTDRGFRLPVLRMAEAQLAHCDRVHVYSFDWRSPLGRLGACHALELGIVFGSYTFEGARRLYGQDEGLGILSEEMRRHWTRFAHGDDLEGWPPYGERRATLRFGTPTRLEHDPEAALRQVWAGADELLGFL